MKGKAALIVGLATGYVLGTRDGRERYEQIKIQANRLMQDPRVQEKASQATDLAKDKAPVLKEKVSGATQKASSKIGKKSDSATNGSPDSRLDSKLDSSLDTPVDEDAIIVTAPPPSPLDPRATSASQTSGGLDG
jgi:hypothetical protein